MCRAFSITKKCFSFFIDTILYSLHLYMRCSCFYIYSKLFKLHQLLPKLYTCKARFYFKWTFVVLIQIRGKRCIIFKTLFKNTWIKMSILFPFYCLFFFIYLFIYLVFYSLFINLLIFYFILKLKMC